MDSAPIKKRSLSIRLKIPILIVTPLITVVMLTGWLAYHDGRRAAEELAGQLSSQISDEIELQAQGYLRKPYLIHHTNAAVIRSGNLNVENLQQLERFLWYQIQQNELVNNVFFGNEQGEFIMVERDDDGKTVVRARDKSTAPKRNSYQLDSLGNRTKLIASDEYDPRTRDWYKAAKETGKAAWSPIYKFSAKPILGITPVMPIMNDTGKLRGVLGIDVSLKQISDFLSKQKISKSGKAFIIEPSGEMVASSIPQETSFITSDKKRVNATDSSQPIIIQRTAQHLLKELSNLDQIDGKPLMSRFQIDGENQFVNAGWLENRWGLKWLIVVVIPESDFLNNFNKAAIFTLFVGLSVTAAATVLGLLAARRITKPISTITDAAAAIEDETFDPESLKVVAWREDELGQLARVFQRMAVNVSDRQQQLKQHVKELDSEIGKFKKERQAAGLKETHYLQELLKKARNLRTPAK